MLAFLDLRVSLLQHLVFTMVFAAKTCQIIGFANVTPMMLYVTLGLNIGVSIMMASVINAIQTSVAAKRDFDDASSLMLGFQRVLRGVCDGGLVLERPSCTIVDDAESLERLLRFQKKLGNTNFLDLFLDEESRDRFLKFADADSSSAVPKGLRVSLQGSNGPVSLDLFHTRIPSSAGDYSLLAMKEDADQSYRVEAPEAPDGVAAFLRLNETTQSQRSQHSESTERIDADCLAGQC